MTHVESIFAAGPLGWASQNASAQSTESLLRAYLIAWLFWLAISLGSQVLLWLRDLTGGAWGSAVRLECVAAAQLLPLAALGSIPMLMNLSAIYPWMHAEHIDPILEQKLAYLNPKWFTIRTIVYFSIWIFAALYTNSLRRKALDAPHERTERAYRRGCAQALLLYGVGMTFAAVDWGMSLEPHWYSSSYGLVFIFGQALAAMAFAVAVGSRRVAENYSHTTLNDLGNLLLALTMLWTYISITQFLIIWVGDLPEENVWYLRRADDGYLWMAIALAIGHFGAPFMLLLRREFKRDPRTIAWIAVVLLIGRWIDLEWNLAPPFGPCSAANLALDAVMVVGVGVPFWLLYNWRRNALLSSEAAQS